MTDPRDQIREYVGERDPDRRLLALLLLLVLVVAGAGVGTIAFDGAFGPGGDDPTPTPPVVEITPVTPTPTPTPSPDPGGGPPAESTPRGTDTPAETATPTATEPPSTPRRSDTPDRDSSSGVELRTNGSEVFLQVAGMVPGDDARGSVVFENHGASAGRLGIANATVVDRENPDDGSIGTLSSALRVRLWATYPGGATEYLYGTASGDVPLADVAGENRTSTETLRSGQRATVTLAVRLPETVGNEVQGDRVEFDVAFELRQAAD